MTRQAIWVTQNADFHCSDCKKANQGKGFMYGKPHYPSKDRPLWCDQCGKTVDAS